MLQVLDLSRLEAGKVELLSEVFEPADVARKCLEMLAARIAAKGIGDSPRSQPLVFMC